MEVSNSSPAATELLIDYDNSDVERSDTISNIQNLFFAVSVFEVDARDLLYSVKPPPDPYVELGLTNCALEPLDYLIGTEGNCSEICSNPTTSMLPWNMRTCYSLGVAAMLVQNGSLALNSSREEDEQYQLYHGNLSDWDGTKVISDFVHCITSSCKSSNISPCKESTLALENITVTAGTLSTIQRGMHDFCSYGVDINDDIAGPGIMLSYLLQVCAVIFFWVLFNTLTRSAWILVSPVFFYQSRGDAEHSRIDPFLNEPSVERRIGPRLQEAWARTSGIQRRLSEGRIYDATVKILKEFQEVQGFFIGTIQIATLYTFKPKSSSSSDSNSVDSFGAAVLDSQLVQMLAVNSIIPLLLVQSMIHRITRYELRKQHKKYQRSPFAWYTFLLIWITVILASVIYARRDELIAGYEELFEKFKKDSSVMECGSNPNPMVYCNVDNSISTRFKMGIFVIYISISLLTIDFLAIQVPNWHQWHIFQKIRGVMDPTQAQVFQKFRRNFWPLFMKAVWFLLECALVVSSAFYLADLLTITHSMTGGANDWGATNSWGSWSFGQLIAVMVWVPTLFKFIFYLKFGVEETNQSQVDGPEQTAVEFDPLQGPDTTWRTSKPVFWAGSQDALLKGSPE